MRKEWNILFPKIPSFYLGWLVAVLVGASTAGSATTNDTLEMAELTVRADLIVDAFATERTSVWIDGTLFTEVHLEIQEVLKGEPTGDITLLLPGGIDLDREIPVAVHWPGAPDIGTGERSLLFLHQGPDQGVRGQHRLEGPYYSIVGFSQGKLSVRAEGGDLVIEGRSGTSEGTRRLSAVKAEIRRTLALGNREVR